MRDDAVARKATKRNRPELTHLAERVPVRGSLPLAPTLAVLAGVDEEGCLLVAVDGEVRPARLCAPGDGAFWRAAASAGAAVLVLAPTRGGDSPIVLGLVRRTIDERHPTPPLPEVLQLEARDALELRCGQSSISLRADGKLCVQGTDVTSRASRSNKLKGGSVQIN
ncbi:MAG TPA: hypothetical protein VEI82_07580 [Myxococcota bacterium]|nr:hypothetical protein [Myxococcota bacterium]